MFFLPALAKRFTAPKPVNVLPVPVPLVNSIPFSSIKRFLCYIFAVRAINGAMLYQCFSASPFVGVPSAFNAVFVVWVTFQLYNCAINVNRCS